MITGHFEDGCPGNQVHCE